MATDQLIKQQFQKPTTPANNIDGIVQPNRPNQMSQSQTAADNPVQEVAKNPSKQQSPKAQSPNSTLAVIIALLVFTVLTTIAVFAAKN